MPIVKYRVLVKRPTEEKDLQMFAPTLNDAISYGQLALAGAPKGTVVQIFETTETEVKTIVN